MVPAIRAGSRLATPRLTYVDLYAWIAQADAGAWLEYHRGFLGIDVTPGISLLASPQRRQLAALAQAALAACEKGLVHLVQARVGPDRFAYIVIARPRPNAAASASSLLIAERAASPPTEGAVA